MEDQSLFNSQPKGGISEDFRQFIKETIEEVLVEGRAFDGQKRWLHRLGETEGVDCNVLERNMTDLIEVVEEWKQLKSKSGERMARLLGKECYLTEQDIVGLLQKLEGGNPAAVSATNPTQDASMMGGGQSAEDEYISECIKEVCIKGDSLSKYQKIIEKKYGVEFYQKCEGFVEEMNRSVDKKKFTNTSVTNLHYLARQIGVSDATVDAIVKHYTDKFEEEERQRQAAEKRKQEGARRKAEEEARRAKEEAERKAREEAERKAREEAERKAKEERERKEAMLRARPKIVATDVTIKRIVLDEIRKYGLDGDLNHIDVSQVTYMRDLFNAKENEVFKRFNCDISKWNVSKVWDMGEMFRDCESFNGDLSKWDVSSVEKMDDMFHGCTVFNCDLSGWDVGSVEDMNGMFMNCKSFNSDLDDWDVSNVEDMSFMFCGCEKFDCCLCYWDVGYVLDMSYMFDGCCIFNGNISGWDVSNVENMSSMFSGCGKFNCDLSEWDVSSVRDMNGMFFLCKEFNCDISSWDVSNVENMRRMFFGCAKFNQDLSDWDVSNCDDYDKMFEKCPIREAYKPTFE